VGVQDTVANIFKNVGIPESVWQPIETVESGGNQFGMNNGTGGSEQSVGLFALNRKGGLGQGYSIVQLFDPATNATIAANAMKPAYDRGVAKGLTGYDLTQYVAYNSGWPTAAGVGALKTDSVVQAYEPKLRNAYGAPDVSNVSNGPKGTVGDIANSITSSTDIFNKLWSMNTLYIIGGSLGILLILVNAAKGGGVK